MPSLSSPGPCVMYSIDIDACISRSSDDLPLVRLRHLMETEIDGITGIVLVRVVWVVKYILLFERETPKL